MTKQYLEGTAWFYGQQTLEEKEAAAKLMDLPRDLIASILSRIGATELLTRVQYVCREWLDICRDPIMWRHVRLDDIHTAYQYNYDWPGVPDRDWWPRWRPSHGHRLLDRLCRLAVDRSLGSMESITIRYLAIDESLLYVAERSRHLKHLRLESCLNHTDEVLISVAAQVPFLEKLEFSYCCVRASVLEAFARCCPLLASLEVVMWPDDNHLSKVVRVIGQRMPHLAHLQLGGFMEDDDLRAILDGCPRLESLDLYNCCGIDLDGELAVRCAKQIKELRLPYDPSDDDSDTYDSHYLNYYSSDDYPISSDYLYWEAIGSEDDHDLHYQEYDDYDDIYLN